MEPTHGCGAGRNLGTAIGACLGVLLVALAAAGADRGEVMSARRTLTAHGTIRGNLPGPVRRQLTLASRLARDSIRTNPACSALFGRFGADGLELLKRVEIEAATFEMAGNACDRGGVPAFTEVNGKTIRLCPGFGVLAVPAAAVTLIHELLHTAGMRERPFDPNGLTPQEINRLVATSCGR